MKKKAKTKYKIPKTLDFDLINEIAKKIAKMNAAKYAKLVAYSIGPSSSCTKNLKSLLPNGPLINFSIKIPNVKSKWKYENKIFYWLFYSGQFITHRPIDYQVIKKDFSVKLEIINLNFNKS